MRELRVVLVRVPPFLADLIRYVVVQRFTRRQAERGPAEGAAAHVDVSLSIIPYAGDETDLGEVFEQFAPHVVISGTAAAVSLRARAVIPTNVRVLTLSPDLTRVFGPEPGDSADLTPDVLADRLRSIAKAI